MTIGSWSRPVFDVWANPSHDHVDVQDNRAVGFKLGKETNPTNTFQGQYLMFRRTLVMTMLVSKTTGQPTSFKLGKETNPTHTFLKSLLFKS